MILFSYSFEDLCNLSTSGHLEAYFWKEILQLYVCHMCLCQFMLFMLPPSGCIILKKKKKKSRENFSKFAQTDKY